MNFKVGEPEKSFLDWLWKREGKCFTDGHIFVPEGGEALEAERVYCPDEVVGFDVPEASLTVRLFAARTRKRHTFKMCLQCGRMIEVKE